MNDGYVEVHYTFPLTLVCLKFSIIKHWGGKTTGHKGHFFWISFLIVTPAQNLTKLGGPFIYHPNCSHLYCNTYFTVLYLLSLISPMTELLDIFIIKFPISFQLPS